MDGGATPFCQAPPPVCRMVSLPATRFGQAGADGGKRTKVTKISLSPLTHAPATGGLALHPWKPTRAPVNMRQATVRMQVGPEARGVSAVGFPVHACGAASHGSYPQTFIEFYESLRVTPRAPVIGRTGIRTVRDGAGGHAAGLRRSCRLCLPPCLRQAAPPSCQSRLDYLDEHGIGLRTSTKHLWQPQAYAAMTMHGCIERSVGLAELLGRQVNEVESKHSPDSSLYGGR